MPKPKKVRAVQFKPEITYFKPRGVLMSELSEVQLAVEELEALRLLALEEMNQTEAAEKMKVSQSTFHRILKSAQKKLADALVNGKAIQVKGGDYIMANLRQGSGRGGRGRGAGRGAAAGGGRGRMGGPKSAGPGGSCVCPGCGHEVAHQAGVPCMNKSCPECGTKMVRK